VAAFVAEDEHDFVVGDASGGGIPHNDALGGSDAADIGVEAVGFFAGLHEEHAVWRDVGAGTGDDLLETGDEVSMILRERFELVEDRFQKRGCKEN